jgi:hypothetical protein
MRLRQILLKQRCRVAAQLEAPHPLGQLGNISAIVDAILRPESIGFVICEILHVDGAKLPLTERHLLGGSIFTPRQTRPPGVLVPGGTSLNLGFWPFSEYLKMQTNDYFATICDGPNLERVKILPPVCGSCVPLAC